MNQFATRKMLSFSWVESKVFFVLIKDLYCFMSERLVTYSKIHTYSEKRSNKYFPWVIT